MHLVCPRDHAELEAQGDALVCALGHDYPFLDGIPVLTDSEVEPTEPRDWSGPDDIERVQAEQPAQLDGAAVDPYVVRMIMSTHGNLYRGLHELPRYPIPSFPATGASGKRALDVGCNWGRWAIAAARAGYDVAGIDPSLEAISAARRIGRQLGESVEYAVADARSLPFPDASFDLVFSYSVLQHFSREAVRKTVGEVARVLAPGGIAYVQMANRWGLWNLCKLARSRFREQGGFGVRYWSPRDLRHTFGRIGATTLLADGFFTLNPQATDLDFLPRRVRPVIRASAVLRGLSRVVPPLTFVADSVWVQARKA